VKLCLVNVFPDIVKDCHKIRNLSDIFVRSFENVAPGLQRTALVKLMTKWERYSTMWANTCPRLVSVLSHVSCTGPMCYPKGWHVSYCATLTDWATDSNTPVQLVNDWSSRSGCVVLPVALKRDHIRHDMIRYKSLTWTQKAECGQLNLAHIDRKRIRSIKRQTKTNKHQCRLSSVQVQDPWRARWVPRELYRAT